MAGITLYLENGFEHDRVVVTVGDAPPVEEADVSTRHQVGLARTLELDAPEGGVTLRLALPDRALEASGLIDAAETPHVTVNLLDGTLSLRPLPEAPRFA